VAWLLLERTTGPALAFKEREYVLVADVVNGTGESVFDLALKSALETGLRQSAYVNVLDPEQVQNTLRLMRLGPDSRLDEAVGLAVCRRAGARALVVPRILRAGEAYQVGASLVEPGTGRVAAETHVAARGREEVLVAAIDQLTGRLRRKLGESLDSIARHDPPLVRYTTSSLEALDLVALGLRASARTDHAKAERCYREALQHDPRFAMARAALGLVLLQFRGQPAEGKAELTRALADANSPRSWPSAVTPRKREPPWRGPCVTPARPGRTRSGSPAGTRRSARTMRRPRSSRAPSPWDSTRTLTSSSWTPASPPSGIGRKWTCSCLRGRTRPSDREGSGTLSAERGRATPRAAPGRTKHRVGHISGLSLGENS
jgi:tetratricopeptide (TPR) repeat protein